MYYFVIKMKKAYEVFIKENLDLAESLQKDGRTSFPEWFQLLVDEHTVVSIVLDKPKIISKRVEGINGWEHVYDGCRPTPPWHPHIPKKRREELRREEPNRQILAGSAIEMDDQLAIFHHGKRKECSYLVEWTEEVRKKIIEIVETYDDENITDWTKQKINKGVEYFALFWPMIRELNLENDPEIAQFSKLNPLAEDIHEYLMSIAIKLIHDGKRVYVMDNENNIHTGQPSKDKGRPPKMIMNRKYKKTIERR